MHTNTKRQGNRCRAAVRSWVMGFVLVGLVGLAPLARAQSSAGFAVDSSPTVVIALAALDLLNLGTAVANTYAVATDQRMVTLAVVSYIGSTAGAVASGVAYAGSNDTGVQVMSAFSFGLAVVNAGLATWNLTRSSQEERRQLALVPSSIMDGEGKAATGLAVAGLF